MSPLRRLAFARLLPAIWCAFCCIPEAFPQSTSGTILGRVTDPQGAVVPGASVTARNDATGFTQGAQTNEDGEYTLPILPPATYTVTVAKENFTTATSEGNKLDIDQKLRLDVMLSVGGVSGTVTVEAEAPLLQTQSSETGQVLGTQRIVDLPLLGRNFFELTGLTTGVTGGFPGGVNNVGISVNGQREYANSTVVDGIEVNANRNNDSTLRPSVDSVQEFKVVTSAYSAEFGRASGAVITVQTKSGANRFSGSGYGFLRPRTTAARSFFSPERSRLQQINFGGTFGGPISTDKTFFFASYEGVRNRNVVTFLGSVPPIDQVRFLPNGDADFSGLLDPYTGEPTPIFDPDFYAQNFYAQQFLGNIIPANRVSSAGRAILQNFFARPTQPGRFNGYFDNIIASQDFRNDQNTVDARIDHNFSERDRLSGVYHVAQFHSLLGEPFAGRTAIAGASGADNSDEQDSLAQSISITETHLFSPAVINELRFGYTRFRLNQLNLLNGQENLATQTGVRNINLPGFEQTNGFPYIFLGTGYVAGGSTFKPLFFLDRNFQLLDSLSFRLGAHDLKIGGDFRLLSSQPNFSLFPTGFFYFGDSVSNLSLTGDPTYSTGVYGGSDIADLLLGLPYSVDLGLKYNIAETKSRETHFYFQDNWQVTRRLVLNLGLRYEYQSPYREASNNAANFDPATLQLLLAGRGANSETLVRSDKNNFSPRVGFALRLSERTVLRGGYGVFYSPENDGRNEVLTLNYPFAQVQQFFNDINGGLPFAYSLDAGVPRQTSVPVGSDTAGVDALTIPNANLQRFYFIDPNFRTGYSQLYNAVLQHQLTRTLSVEAAYVGSQSHKLPYAIGNLNRAGRLSNRLGSINGQFSIGNANYNSLQLKADKRFAQGLSFLAAYTFSKSIDDGPGPFNLGVASQQPQNPFDLRTERAVSGNDVRHNFVSSFSYDLPFGRGKRFLSALPGVLDAVLGGFQINGIFRYRSGLPFGVVRNPGRGDFAGLRPNLIGDPLLSETERTLDRYFNIDAFSNAGFTGARLNAPGTAGRNILRGPDFKNFDFSAFKQFPLTFLREGAELELRFEFFNLTNTPNFANPDGNRNSADFGRIRSTIGNPRIVQFAAKMNF